MVKATLLCGSEQWKEPFQRSVERLLIWFLQVLLIQCFSEVMAAQLLADRMFRDSATFHLWMRVWRTRRFLQVVVTQYFSEVMAEHLLVDTMNTDNATFHLLMRVWCTPMFLQVVVIQCFSEVMAVQLLAEWTTTDNAEYHLWSHGVSGWAFRLQAFVTFLIWSLLRGSQSVFCNSSWIAKLMPL